MPLSCQTLYSQMHRKTNPRRVEGMPREQQLAYILGSQQAADEINAFMRRNPSALNMTPEQLAATLATLDGVGRGKAVQYVLLTLYCAGSATSGDPLKATISQTTSGA